MNFNPQIATKPPCRLVRWWRKITGRDVYKVGVDFGDRYSRSAWCVVVKDQKTGIVTVLDQGHGPVPKKYAKI